MTHYDVRNHGLPCLASSRAPHSVEVHFQNADALLFLTVPQADFLEDQLRRNRKQREAEAFSEADLPEWLKLSESDIAAHIHAYGHPPRDMTAAGNLDEVARCADSNPALDTVTGKWIQPLGRLV